MRRAMSRESSTAGDRSDNLEHRAEARPEGHEAILTELRVADDEQLTRPIDIGDIKAADLPYAQAEAV